MADSCASFHVVGLLADLAFDLLEPLQHLDPLVVVSALHVPPGNRLVDHGGSSLPGSSVLVDQVPALGCILIGGRFYRPGDAWLLLAFLAYLFHKSWLKVIRGTYLCLLRQKKCGLKITFGDL